MRIALVTDFYLPTLGGVQTVVKAHLEELTAAGHAVTVFAPIASRTSSADVVALPIADRFAPVGYPFAWPSDRVESVLLREFEARGIDVVHVHSEMVASLGAYRVARRLGLPVVQTMHGRVDVYTRTVLPVPAVTTIVAASMHSRLLTHDGVKIEPGTPYTRTRSARRMWRLMVSQANHASHVIVPSHHLAAKLRTQGVTSPLHIVSNGLEHTVLERIGAATQRTYEPGTPLRALWVGRLSPEKRPDVFLEAIAATPGVTADVYGDGVWRKKVSNLARRIGSRVTLHGGVAQSEVLAAMRQAHIVVSTSYDFDNAPMVILEAIASGLPVIVADPDLAELLPPGSGIVSSSPDAGGIAQAIARYRDEPGLVAEHSAAAIAHREAVSQSATVDRLVDIYSRALAAQRG